MEEQKNPKRICRHCDKAFDKKQKESWNGYALRIYCSRACLLDYMAKQRAIAYKRKQEGGAANASKYPIG